MTSALAYILGLLTAIILIAAMRILSLFTTEVSTVYTPVFCNGSK